MELWFVENIWIDYAQNIAINSTLNYAKYVGFVYFLNDIDSDDFIDKMTDYLLNGVDTNPLLTDIVISVGTSVLIKDDLFKYTRSAFIFVHCFHFYCVELESIILPFGSIYLFVVIFIINSKYWMKRIL